MMDFKLFKEFINKNEVWIKAISIILVVSISWISSIIVSEENVVVISMFLMLSSLAFCFLLYFYYSWLQVIDYLFKVSLSMIVLLTNVEVFNKNKMIITVLLVLGIFIEAVFATLMLKIIFSILKRLNNWLTEFDSNGKKLKSQGDFSAFLLSHNWGGDIYSSLRYFEKKNRFDGVKQIFKSEIIDDYSFYLTIIGVFCSFSIKELKEFRSYLILGKESLEKNLISFFFSVFKIASIFLPWLVQWLFLVLGGATLDNKGFKLNYSWILEKIRSPFFIAIAAYLIIVGIIAMVIFVIEKRKSMKTRNAIISIIDIAIEQKGQNDE